MKKIKPKKRWIKERYLKASDDKQQRGIGLISETEVWRHNFVTRKGDWRRTIFRDLPKSTTRILFAKFLLIFCGPWVPDQVQAVVNLSEPSVSNQQKERQKGMHETYRFHGYEAKGACTCSGQHWKDEKGQVLRMKRIWKWKRNNNDNALQWQYVSCR